MQKNTATASKLFMDDIPVAASEDRYTIRFVQPRTRKPATIGNDQPLLLDPSDASAIAPQNSTRSFTKPPTPITLLPGSSSQRDLAKPRNDRTPDNWLENSPTLAYVARNEKGKDTPTREQLRSEQSQPASKQQHFKSWSEMVALLPDSQHDHISQGNSADQTTHPHISDKTEFPTLNSSLSREREAESSNAPLVLEEPPMILPGSSCREQQSEANVQTSSDEQQILSTDAAGGSSPALSRGQARSRRWQDRRRGLGSIRLFPRFTSILRGRVPRPPVHDNRAPPSGSPAGPRNQAPHVSIPAVHHSQLPPRLSDVPRNQAPLPRLPAVPRNQLPLPSLPTVSHYQATLPWLPVAYRGEAPPPGLPAIPRGHTSIPALHPPSPEPESTVQFWNHIPRPQSWPWPCLPLSHLASVGSFVPPVLPIDFGEFRQQLSLDPPNSMSLQAADLEGFYDSAYVSEDNTPEADRVRFLGTGPVPIRPMQGFGQENVRTRNPTTATNRVSNGKLGNPSSWGGAFGMHMGGAPGLQDLPQRNLAGGGGMGAFGQTISGSQPATPLDPSEFPSLSGTQQTQQNPGQATWGHRPNQPNQTTNPRQQSSLPKPQQAQTGHDDLFAGASQFPGGLGDYGHSAQPQPGNMDEFPPLGRETSSGLGQERRGSLLQNNAFGGYGASMAFASMTPQQGNPLSGGLERERVISPAVPGVGLISSRSPNPPGTNGNGPDKIGTIGSGADPSARSREFSSQPQGQQSHSSSAMMGTAFGGNDIVDSPSSLQQPGTSQNLDQMASVDRYGLPGLLATMHHPSADLRSLSGQGQDLTTLGLDLASTEQRLHSRLASVFDPSAQARVPMDSDFTLPACYRVANVQGLHDRIPSFSEETLFYIFYSSPKDMVQELVADELIGRKWRFHRGEKMWVTRDENFPAPVEVEREVSEQGSYLWWDWRGWKKVRRQYTLRYEDLDNGSQRSGATLNQLTPLTGPSNSIAQSGGMLTR